MSLASLATKIEIARRRTKRAMPAHQHIVATTQEWPISKGNVAKVMVMRATSNGTREQLLVLKDVADALIAKTEDYDLACRVLTEIARAMPSNIGADPCGASVELLARLRHSKALMLRIASIVTARDVQDRTWALAVRRNAPKDLIERIPQLLDDPDEIGEVIEAAPSQLLTTLFAGTAITRALRTHVPLSLPEDKRAAHCHIVAQSGAGKTQLIQMLIRRAFQPIAEGKESVFVFDSKGGIGQKLLDHCGLPDDRIVYIDPADSSLCPEVNIFEPGGSPAMVSYILEALDEQMTGKQGTLFSALASIMMSIPGASLGDLLKILSDDSALERHSARLSDEDRDFIATDWTSSDFAETKKQLRRRLRALIKIDAIKRLLGSSRTTFRIYDHLDRGVLMIVRLDKDHLGESTALVARAFMGPLTKGLWSRSKSTFLSLIVDEALDLLSKGDDWAIAEYLAQGREKRAGAVIAHQWLSQLPKQVNDALTANAMIRFAANVRPGDDLKIAASMGRQASALQGLPTVDRSHGMFLGMVNGLIYPAAAVRVPFGLLESMPKRTDDEMASLMAYQRQLWAQPVSMPKVETPAAAVEMRKPAWMDDGQ